MIPPEFGDWIRWLVILLTNYTTNSDVWLHWLDWMGLKEEYTNCLAVTDYGAAVLRTLFDWLWMGLTNFEGDLHLSDIYDVCSPDN